MPMENKIEQLLNSLIEKGWKPSWKECSHFIMQHDADVLDWKVIYTAVRKDEWVYNIHYTLRELVSKESWLWQFVCKNGMVKKEQNVFENYWKDKYEYWLCKCALKDESELEDFLLNSIKLD